MLRCSAALLVIAAAAAACSHSKERKPAAAAARTKDAAPELPNTTPTDFFADGAPTFVVGTAGDDRSDRAIAIQVELVRGMKFPDAPVVEDRAVNGWPEHAVVYGGPHVNALIARIADTLPFAIEPGKLEIGGHTFTGDGYQLITVVPASAGHPEFMFYAGTGTPGIGEINAVPHGPAPILVADTFGPLATGYWESAGDGAVRAVLDPPSRRIEWRAVTRDYVTFLFPKSLPPAPDEDELIDVCMRGVATAASKLAIAQPGPIDVYVYPDHGSKRSLTGIGGDGHAVVASHALHIVRGGDVESLVTHESTHVLGYAAWGPAATPLLGEGLAVWVSGRYGGRPLASYRAGVDAPPKVAELLGPSFRELPERTSYPLAGLFVGVAVDTVGLDNVRDHLMGAGPSTWDRACRSAGTTPEALEAAFARSFAR